jgi:hypothetical protein
MRTHALHLRANQQNGRPHDDVHDDAGNDDRESGSFSHIQHPVDSSNLNRGCARGSCVRACVRLCVCDACVCADACVRACAISHARCGESVGDDYSFMFVVHT